ncbi:DUF5067 domain-containing protein [Convivina intestini]|uniref:Uncharacterized protein DUF5067 n=1 Tax=Convivina intestini TaxID=1505726 RepID=A0A2U1DFN7_9LACO|nr:DUF5067 domain-containing protein [Convivina intestini]PVY86389.1 uncharacterized protein DUF5067 [Convivina intestini]CAH1850531.1 hypothetical protein R077811_00109 [Convivina intestini]SDB83206.1 protein of unknown function [Leuconostocaceae bacterium R-53105]
MKQDERKVLGILAIVFGGIALALSWIPIINNIAFLFGIVGLVLGVISLFINRKNKKILAIIGASLSIISILIVLGTQSTYSKAIDKATGISTTETAKDNTSKKSDWSFTGNTYNAGNLKLKFGKSEIIDGIGDNNPKVLVLHADMTNISDKEMDADGIYATVHAYQKTDKQNKTLNPGLPKFSNDGKQPFEEEQNNLHNKLLPGKTVPVVVIFELDNDSTVTVKFSNDSFKDIGSKTYEVK